MRRILVFVSVAALGLSLAARPAVAEESARWSAGALSDQRLFQMVADTVNRYVNFTIFDDISASVENGVVTLSGKVTMPYKKSEIGRRVEKVDGVKELRNAIEVLPVSIFDDELRFRIARAIYRNPSFWQYAAMANPPIHIVVDRGHVTLSGVVATNVDRALARSLASGFGEFSVTNNLKTDAEMRAAISEGHD
ncbi:MAG: BON domain-containing protein [Acidobacteria bacterium]|nr:BON domain-containing protein [Acidobacteriota bacterium]